MPEFVDYKTAMFIHKPPVAAVGPQVSALMLIDGDSIDERPLLPSCGGEVSATPPPGPPPAPSECE